MGVGYFLPPCGAWGSNSGRLTLSRNISIKHLFKIKMFHSFTPCSCLDFLIYSLEVVKNDFLLIDRENYIMI